MRVFERESEPGGLAAGFVVEPEDERAQLAGQPVYLDKFYHHLFASDRHITRLIEELGMGADLEWLRPLTVTLWQGQVYQLDSPLSLLRFPPVPFVGRLRMAAALALLKLLPSADLLEGRTAAQWVRASDGRGARGRPSSRRCFKGKFGAVSEQIALPWLWARFHDRTSRLGYVRGGFQRFYNRLAERVQRARREADPSARRSRASRLIRRIQAPSR